MKEYKTTVRYNRQMAEAKSPAIALQQNSGRRGDYVQRNRGTKTAFAM